jgi:hypothetical protein
VRPEGGGGSGGSAGSGGTSASGGTTAAGTGGRTAGTGGTPGTGGRPGTGGAPGTGGSTTADFDWGTTTYNSSGGSSVRYQGHYTGQGCLSCKSFTHRTFTFGGTVYQGNGSSTAANAQIGILVNGSLTTTYSGSQGNFYASISGSAWSTAQIAVRTSAGTRVMPANSTASGDCNSCHGTSNRLVTP